MIDYRDVWPVRVVLHVYPVSYACSLKFAYQRLWRSRLRCIAPYSCSGMYVCDLHVMCHILYINTLARVAAELSSDVYFEPDLMQQIH